MPKQEIRDRNNKLLARIETLSTGKQEIRDPNNKLLGRYDPKVNKTRDPNNKLLAKGNILSSLI